MIRLSKTVPPGDWCKPHLLSRRSRILAVLGIVATASGCTGEKTSRGPDTASSATASQTPPTLAAADTQHVVLSVKGMYCASCEQTVVTMLRRTAGVLRADVSVEKAEATVSYDSARTSPEKLVQVVKTLGYEASVKPT